jgi:hypothetical protein
MAGIAYLIVFNMNGKGEKRRKKRKEWKGGKDQIPSTKI